jgi:hypothetical protein
MLECKFPLLKKFINAFDSENRPAHLIFGDSVALRVADDDVSKDTLEDFIEAEFGGEGSCCISHSSFHSQVFALFCNALARVRYQPRSVILPINLRSFSASWDLHPDRQFLWETATLDDFSHGREEQRQPIKSTPVSKAIFQSVPLHLPSGDIRTIGEFLEVIASHTNRNSSEAWNTRIREIFTYHYMYNLHPNHRKLRYFGSAIKTLLRKGIGVGLYITPVNYSAGNLYVGESFEKCMSDNLTMIEGYLRTFGVEVVDISDLRVVGVKQTRPTMLNLAYECNKDDFFTPHNATEHLRGAARKVLAGNIAMLAKAVAHN